MTAWLAFCAGHGVDSLKARRAHVDAWTRIVQSGGAAPRTVARRLASVSSWYRYLVTEGLRPDSPAEHVRRPEISDRGETPASPATRCAALLGFRLRAARVTSAPLRSHERVAPAVRQM
jgi:integrase/recombinase XerD